ncbi:ATP-dependent DNA ligase [Campylobacterota bacterium]|nr:ATP-dependent DNA ligase [Campylobacterota bacterium]
MSFKTSMLQAAIATLIATTSLNAHFQVVLTDKTVIEAANDAKIAIRYEFLHPFEKNYMQMAKPQEVGVFANGKRTKIDVTAKKQEGFTVYSGAYTVKEPSVYQFYVDPAPYFEPSEQKFIRHQTKTIVDAFGAGEGWDEPVGLKAEIVPLARPYSIIAGGLFSGVVLYKGKPVADATIEIEYYNDRGLKAPNEMTVTLATKADSNGVFHVALPLEGWWGFAALIDDDETIVKDGKKYPIELGAVLWLKTVSYR